MALAAGRHGLVKSSITGALLSMLLLVMGLAFFVGGILMSLIGLASLLIAALIGVVFIAQRLRGVTELSPIGIFALSSAAVIMSFFFNKEVREEEYVLLEDVELFQSISTGLDFLPWAWWQRKKTPKTA